MFTSPLLLWGLLALAVPLIVHLLELQRPRLLLFSQLRFLTQVMQSERRRQTLKRWLLLLLRLGAVAAVVLAMAGLRWGSQPARGDSLVVVLDDSPSLTLPREGVNSWEQSRQIARRLIEQAGPAATVTLVTSSSLEAGVQQLTPSQALRALDALQPGAASASMATVLQRLASLSESPAARYVIVTDGQRALWADTALTANAALARRTTLVVLEGTPPNRWLGQPRLLTQAPVAGQALRLALPLHSAGDQPSRRVRLSVSLEGQPVAQATAEFRADTVTAEVSLTPSRGGWLAGHIELDDPAGAFDNRVPFVIHLAPRPRVAWLEGPERSPYLDALRTSVLTDVEHLRLPDTDLARLRLDQTQALVLADVRTLASGEVEALRDFVERGGGLLLWPGTHTDPAALNALAEALRLGRFEPPAPLEPPQSLTAASLDHPLLAGAFVRPEAGEVFDGPTVTRRWLFKPAGVLPEATVLPFADGLPLLYEAAVGRGRVVVITSYATDAWSDWPRRTSFAPLLLRGLDRLARSTTWPLTLDPTEQPLVEWPTTGAALVRLIGPGGTLLPAQRQRGGRTLLDFTEVPTPAGLYDVTRADSLLARLAVRIPLAESDPTQLSADQARAWLSERGWGEAQLLSGSPTQTLAALSGAAGGNRLPYALLALALLLLVAELAVARLIP